MKITILDAKTLGGDLDLSPIKNIAETEVYDITEPSDVEKRILKSDIVIINKIKLSENNLKNAANLKLICLAATGYDNVDTEYCAKKGIGVCNVVGYSTESVAQLTLAFAFALSTNIPAFCKYVSSGEYSKGGVANKLEPVYHEMAGKTWGIIGCGNIGKKVAQVAEALGCRVLVNKRTPSDIYQNADIDTICKNADIISLHLPLSDETRGIINRERIQMMKPTSILINVARGAVTDEDAVAEAVLNKKIGGFGCDVYSLEPFSENHPFYAIKDFENVMLTPHMAWGAYEARVRCVNEIAHNIKSFIAGERKNRIE